MASILKRGALISSLLVAAACSGPDPAGSPAPTAAAVSFSVAENAPRGTKVGDIVVTGSAGTPVELAITGGNESNAFALDPTTGTLTVEDSSQLDYESVRRFALTIRVQSGSEPASSSVTTVEIRVLDVNEAPLLESASFKVVEGSPAGTLVGTLACADPDRDDRHTYRILQGNDLGIFALDSQTGALTVADAKALDFEAASRHVLSVEVSDGGTPPLRAKAEVTVVVVDSNEPPAVAFSSFLVPENLPQGSLVGKVEADDPESAPFFHWAIVAGNGQNAFAIDEEGQLTVQNAEALDFETSPSFTLTVQATEPTAPVLAAWATVVVELMDVNEPPEFAGESRFTLAENSPVSSLAGRVLASDPDVGQTLAFRIVGGDEGFAIDIQSGEIVVDRESPLDFESKETYYLDVEVIDDGDPRLAATQRIAISLVDVNEPPVVFETFLSVRRAAEAGTEVGTVVAQDPDWGDSIELSIVGGDPLGAFSIDPATGRILVADAAGLAGVAAVDLVVRAVDSAGLTGANVAHVAVLHPPVAMPDELRATTGSVLVSSLVANDDRGGPQAQVVSFGGGALGGDLTGFPAGSTATFAGGSVTVQADGRVEILATRGGNFAFGYRLASHEGASDASVSVEVCLELQAGEVWMSPDPLDKLCVSGGTDGAEIVLIPVNLDPFGMSLLTVSSENTVAVEGGPSPDKRGTQRPGLQAFPRAAGAGAFEVRLRELEREALEPLLANRSPRDRLLGESRSITPGVPMVGEKMVLNTNFFSPCDWADNRMGEVKHVGNRILIVEDESNPAGGMTLADYEAIANAFDNLVFPTLTGAFGIVTDLDLNERIVAFYTRAVNELTPPGVDYYVSGLFFARDLFPTEHCPASNFGEIVYLLAPDPSGEVSGLQVPTDFVKRITVGSLAHEMQHVLNASRRIFANGADTFEEVWLNEGLSHIAEELVYFRASGFGPKKDIKLDHVIQSPESIAAFLSYAEQNVSRMRQWLLAPHASGLFQANDNLATRGAAWAFLRYVADRTNDEAALWHALVRDAKLAGMANLEAALGQDPRSWLQAFTAAVYGDDSGVDLADAYTFRSWNFRSIFSGLDYSDGAPFRYPLAVQHLPGGGQSATFLSEGGGAAYLRFGVAPGQQGLLRIGSFLSAEPENTKVTLMRTK